MHRISVSGKTVIFTEKYDKAMRRLKEKRLAYAMWCVMSCSCNMHIEYLDRANARKAMACNTGILKLLTNF